MKTSEVIQSQELSSSNPGVDRSSPVSRRRFLKVGGMATGLAAAGAGLASLQAAQTQPAITIPTTITPVVGGNGVSPVARRMKAFQIRVNSALSHLQAPLPPQVNNGEQSLYPDKGATFTKGLVHDSFGRVDLVSSYPSFVRALASGNPADFDKIILGGVRTLNDPQGSLAFQLEGDDPTALTSPPAPLMASEAFAAEMIEMYWGSLLRDVDFNSYATNPIALAAAAELNRLTSYAGPRNSSGHVTTNELFRGSFVGELTGPYISQFAVLPTFYGAQPISQQWQVFLPAGGGGADYMTDFPSWLAVQNGAYPTGLQFDPVYRYVRNGRDFAAMTHVDVPPQAAFVALLLLLGMGAPLNPGQYYARPHPDNGFATLGGPDFSQLVSEVVARALQVVWWQKWMNHLRARPEVPGAFAHLALTGKGNETNVQLSSTLLNSQAVASTFSQYGTYLLPQAFPEGSPIHPDYPTGHGTWIGASITVLKFLFDGTFVIPNPAMVDAASNGTALIAYTGPGLTVNGELNKLASNVTFGHGIHAGIHYRSASYQSVLLGEAVALAILQDKASCYNQKFTVNIQKLDGTTATISNE
jgi:hypothetical protein